MRADACPTSKELADWLEGATHDGSAELEAHIETCEICKDQIHRIESGDLLLAELKGIASPSSSESLDRDRLSRITAAYRRVQKAKLADYPTHIRDYELLEILGQGGMGTVFRARHVPLNRLVALKILPPDSAQRVERFQRELAHHGPLDHPHIVKALDAGAADGVHFLVTELVEGKNAAQLVAEKGALRVKEACDIARQTALGLAYLHERGLVHRDVKPSNVMIDANGHVRLLDLGLVAPAEDESADDRMTKDRTILGTPDYIAPEQINDPRSVDGRADLYGLGCTLFHLLAGKPPFADHPLLKKLHAHQYEEPQMGQIQQPMAPALVELLSQLLAKQLELRPENATIVAQRLTAMTSLEHNDYPPVVMPPKPFTAPPKPVAAAPNSSLLFIVLVILGLLIALPIMLALCAGVLFFFGYSSTVLKQNASFDNDNISISPYQGGEHINEPAKEIEGDHFDKQLGMAPTPDAPTPFRLGAHSQPVATIAFSHDGTAAYSACANQLESLLTWDPTARTQLDSVDTRAALAMAPHPTDPNLLLLGVASNVIVWDRTAKKAQATFPNSGIVTCLATSPGIDKVAVGTSMGSVAFWNLKTREQTGSLEYQGAITAIAMSSDGGLIATATDRRHVAVWNAVDDRTTGQMTINDQAIALTFNVDATMLYVVEGYSDRHRSLWQRVVKFDLGGNYQFETSIAETGDLCQAATIQGNTLLIGCADGTIRCWYLDRDIARFQWRQKVHEQPVTALSISPTGTTAISGARDGSVYQLDLTAK